MLFVSFGSLLKLNYGLFTILLFYHYLRGIFRFFYFTELYMSESFSEAVKLMLTGMSTVFVILILVVILGNLIVIVTNRLYVESPVASSLNQEEHRELSPQQLAAIVATVEALTGGKGKVASVEKPNQ